MDILEKVKINLFLEHDQDDKLLQNLISAAVNYAESFQHIPTGTYTSMEFSPNTEMAVILLASHFYKSRTGSVENFFADIIQTGNQVWSSVNMLLLTDRSWKV